MANFNVGAGYELFNGYFQRGRTGTVEWGIKIHVSANLRSAQALCDLVLPLLIAREVQHKVRASMEDLGRIESEPQMRKFITIYPDDEAQLEAICDELNYSIMNSLATGAATECLPIPGDQAWGHTGHLYIRFGNFKRADVDDDRENVSGKIDDYNKRGMKVFVQDRVAAANARRYADREAELNALFE